MGTADTDTTASPIVTAADRARYERDGYFVLERVLADEQLDLLRAGAADGIARRNAEMDAAGVDQIRLNLRDKRYFVRALDEQPELASVLFGETFAAICRATIGETAYLFFEQYVIKAGDRQATAFAWHQDSGYVGHDDHRPYVTCWIALDDVTEENGSVYLLPYTRSGIRTYVKHVEDPRLNDMVGYFGDDPGLPVEVPAGSIVVFSSTVFHRSGANLTDRLRRVYIAQYSAEVITDRAGDPAGSAVPFLRDGEIVNRAS